MENDMLNGYKQQYPRRLEKAFLTSLFILILTFLLGDGKYRLNAKDLPEPKIVLNTIDIARTVQPPKRKPPVRPSCFVESEEETEILDPLALDVLFELNPLENFAPPAEEDIPTLDVWQLNKKPVPIHIPKPKFPDMAKKIGMEGTVVVMVVISTKGLVESAEIITRTSLFDEAALKAAKKARFKPARQMDKPVKVKMSLPFQFKLR